MPAYLPVAQQWEVLTRIITAMRSWSTLSLAPGPHYLLLLIHPVPCSWSTPSLAPGPPCPLLLVHPVPCFWSTLYLASDPSCPLVLVHTVPWSWSAFSLAPGLHCLLLLVHLVLAPGLHCLMLLVHHVPCSFCLIFVSKILSVQQYFIFPRILNFSVISGNDFHHSSYIN